MLCARIFRHRRRTSDSPRSDCRATEVVLEGPIAFDDSGELDGIRTHDPMIKSHVLYRLSYELSPSG